ncbi:MAG: hypothetical protein KGJ23_15745 [Euryarchaeota archaeon]|nr:hypothetical protein [Euryarchaeota archaeon]MDE1838053.1 hypothetical protein [Euryarchaeota archaeon]MDE1882332.1 hypothetical protein [Euryarchaeota archaeon]MDE2046737.1 hypothetical protein [Thermoplasmata archaeon]
MMDDRSFRVQYLATKVSQGTDTPEERAQLRQLVAPRPAPPVNDESGTLVLLALAFLAGAFVGSALASAGAAES